MRDVNLELAGLLLDRPGRFAPRQPALAGRSASRTVNAHARLAGIPERRMVNYWSEQRCLDWAQGAWTR